MTLLLDTHALLWWLRSDVSLSRRAVAALSDPSNDLLVSAATAWELATKVRIGRLPGYESLVSGYTATLRRARMQALAIDAEDALRAGSLAGPHRDPFDRMIAAQALLRGLTVVTVDPAFASWSVATLW